jgi:hypothetical protein
MSFFFSKIGSLQISRIKAQRIFNYPICTYYLRFKFLSSSDSPFDPKDSRNLDFLEVLRLSTSALAVPVSPRTIWRCNTTWPVFDWLEPSIALNPVGAASIKLYYSRRLFVRTMLDRIDLLLRSLLIPDSILIATSDVAFQRDLMKFVCQVKLSTMHSGLG